MSRMHTSGLGTIGAAFLYLDALNRQAILVGREIGIDDRRALAMRDPHASSLYTPNKGIDRVNNN